MPPRVAELPLGEDERLLVQHVELGVHVPRVQRPEHLSKSIIHCKDTFFAAKMHFRSDEYIFATKDLLAISVSIQPISIPIPPKEFPTIIVV